MLTEHSLLTKMIMCPMTKFIVLYHSHSYNKEQRLPYLKELLQNYEKGDFSEYTTFIFMLRVAPEYPLSECEKIYFSEIIKMFPTEANILQGIGFDETLGEERLLYLERQLNS
jgi:hypothetical protein